jgi:murein DD-endopeptidase MepM/ murein hydrolase activator NlpD
VRTTSALVCPGILFMVALLTLNGCTQPSGNAQVYKYAGKNGGAGSLGIHTVRSGDTLWSIANSYKVDLRDLLDANALYAPYALKSGQRLKIPAPMTYTAKNGDTLYKVSRMFDTTTTELAQLNGLRAPFLLKDKQPITLPSQHSNTAPLIKTAPVRIAQVNYVPTPIEKIQKEVLPSSLPPNSRTIVVKNTQKENQSTRQDYTANIRAAPVSLSLSQQGFLKPVSGKIISGFGTKADGLHNDGINIKAAKGEAVRASEQGVVVYSGHQIEGYGNLVLMRHANGYVTAYAHMDKILAKKGEVIRRGQVIGTVGSTGHVESSQLHFEIRKGKTAINPVQLIRS